MKAISIMATLVADPENRRLYQEFEVVYESGETRSVRVIAHRSIRVDLDALYKEEQDESPSKQK